MSSRRKVTGGQAKKDDHEAAFSIHVALSPARTPLRVLKLKLQKDHGIPYGLMRDDHPNPMMRDMNVGFFKDDQNMNTTEGEAVEGWATDCDRGDRRRGKGSRP